ncbi:hypothetical protein D3C76_1316820 [compost metagenome]
MQRPQAGLAPIEMTDLFTHPALVEGEGISMFYEHRQALMRLRLAFGLFTNVLVPQFRLVCNKCLHHLDAFFVFQHFKLDPTLAEQGLFAHKRLVLGNHYFAYAIQQDGATAHRAGG